jgi:hypothetical protein
MEIGNNILVGLCSLYYILCMHWRQFDMLLLVLSLFYEIASRSKGAAIGWSIIDDVRKARQ